MVQGRLREGTVSDTEKAGQWTAFVCRFPPTSSQTPEYDRETELLQAAGYENSVLDRGQTQHETKEQADAAVWEMVRKLSALDPTIEWTGKAVFSRKGRRDDRR